jgi:hypothetical protein
MSPTDQACKEAQKRGLENKRVHDGMSCSFEDKRSQIIWNMENWMRWSLT